MKTILRSLSASPKNGFSSKPYLLICFVLICSGNCLFGAVKPAGKKHPSLHAKRAGLVAAPTISYSGPQSYTIKNAISPLSPTSSGVAAAAYSGGSPGIFAMGFSNPRGIGIDNKGNVYVADFGNDKVYKIAAGSNTPVSIGSGFTGPVGVAIDFAGNVYVGDYQQSKIFKIPAGGGNIVEIGSGYNGLLGIAADAAGNVYAANYGGGNILKIPAGGGAQTIFASGFTNPSGVAVDSLGNVFVSDFTTSNITKIPPNGGARVSFGSDYLRNPYGLTVDASGNIFVADWNHDSVVEIPIGGGNPVALNNSFNTITGVAVDAEGNVIIVDYGNPYVTVITPAGGYYISTPLPAGLSFDNATGIISGTPTAISPPTNYAITAYNSTGKATAIVNIKTINNALLSGLSISAGSLSPAFASATTGYTATVGNTITTTTVTPTVSGAGATVKVNGTPVASGTASAPISLAVGTNAVNIVVTAADGTTTTAYTVTITRAASSNAKLTRIAVNSGTSLTAVTGPGYQNYTTSVPNSTSTIAVTATAQDATAIIKVNGTTVASATPSPAITLPVGNTVINTIVTAQDGVTANNYIITVNRAPAGSNDALLSKIATNSGVALTQVTGADYRDYTISVPNTTTTITVTPTTHDATATVKVNGATVASGAASSSIPLAVGNTVINTVVTAQDGITVKTYSITVTRAAAASTNALLTKITTNTGVPLTQVSGTDYRDYSISVPNATNTIAITPTTQDDNATVKVNGATVASGTPSASIPLAVGNTVINTVVTAGDGTTVKTYAITVTRAAPASTNALLSKIATNSGVALTQVSGTDYRNYTITVSNAVSSITVTPTTQDATATVKVNGATVASGTASASIPLAAGNTIINTIVTAQDGTTTKTYGITVTRSGPGMSLYISADSLITADVNTVNDGIMVHQGVTPNGDGINDIFTIDGINAYPDNHVTIMGRNGAVIFDVNGYDNQTKFFDGHSGKNHSMQLPGTYFYSLEYVVKGKPKLKTGFIVLKY